jgi:hypothetical protein
MFVAARSSDHEALPLHFEPEFTYQIVWLGVGYAGGTNPGPPAMQRSPLPPKNSNTISVRLLCKVI